MAIGNLVLLSVGFVARFAILGRTNVKIVLIIDVLGVVVKFISGYFLVGAGEGASGILLSFLLSALLIGCVSLAVFVKKFGVSIGDARFVKEIIKDSLVNIPSKVSKTAIFSLSVVLLAYIGISASDVGVFYVVLMISMTGGRLGIQYCSHVYSSIVTFKVRFDIR